MSRVIGESGRPYGHVTGHSYLDVEVLRRRTGRIVLRVVHGSMQGVEQEHGRAEYSGESVAEAKAAALAEEERPEARKHIHTACTQAEARGRKARVPADGASGKRVTIRLTDSEHALLSADAEAAGQDVATYIRARVL